MLFGQGLILMQDRDSIIPFLRRNLPGSCHTLTNARHLYFISDNIQIVSSTSGDDNMNSITPNINSSPHGRCLLLHNEELLNCTETHYHHFSVEYKSGR